jgi:Na+-transporting NADH:ubiquinone oxidoreductase subunit C
VAEHEHLKSKGWLSRLAAMPNDSPQKTLIVAVVLCFFCSIAVAASAVLLRPMQERNKALAMRTEVLKVAGLYEEGRDINALFERIDTRIVDLATGAYVDNINPDEFDQRAAARDPQASVAIAPEADIARISRRAKYAPVYIVRENERPKTIILPVHGYGLWSTLYAFVALAADGRTVEAVTFYEHAETPGLGAEVENPKWQATWKGKILFADDGRTQFQVKKGSVDPGTPEAAYSVDGLTGATLTSNGVTNLIRYWLGDGGFGPFLARFRSEN